MERLLLTTTEGFEHLPVAAGFDFDHTDPMFTLPIEVRAAADLTGEPRLELLESGVCC